MDYRPTNGHKSKPFLSTVIVCLVDCLMHEKWAWLRTECTFCAFGWVTAFEWYVIMRPTTCDSCVEMMKIDRENSNIWIVQHFCWFLAMNPQKSNQMSGLQRQSNAMTQRRFCSNLWPLFKWFQSKLPNNNICHSKLASDRCSASVPELVRIVNESSTTKKLVQVAQFLTAPNQVIWSRITIFSCCCYCTIRHSHVACKTHKLSSFDNNNDRKLHAASCFA